MGDFIERDSRCGRFKTFEDGDPDWYRMDSGCALEMNTFDVDRLDILQDALLMCRRREVIEGSNQCLEERRWGPKE